MTTIEYWTNTAGASAPATTGPIKDHSALNWRLLLAFSLNLVAWAALLKTL